MSDRVPNDQTGAAAPTRADIVNEAVSKYAKKASVNVIQTGNYNQDKNAAIIAASMYALAVELGLVDIEEQS